MSRKHCYTQRFSPIVHNKFSLRQCCAGRCRRSACYVCKFCILIIFNLEFRFCFLFLWYQFFSPNVKEFTCKFVKTFYLSVCYLKKIMLKVITTMDNQTVDEYEIYFAFQAFLTGSSCVVVGVGKVRALCARVNCIFA